jgi:ribose transport system ATP-binding protein
MSERIHLALRGIRKSFGGVEVLHGVDLDAAGGSVLVLLGENGAGKSTLVKIIAGDYRPDVGEIELGGETRRALDPLAAQRLGIRMIFQELSDAAALTVAENISLGRLPSRSGIVHWRELRRRAVAVLDQLGVEIDPDAPAASLTLGERQMIEIARALCADAKLLILDEPTAALSAAEVERLFAVVERLRAQGVALIYITHRLDEIARIGDRVQVLRDGATVLNKSVTEVETAELVTAMVGREIGAPERPEPLGKPSTQPRMSFRGVSSPGAFADLDLDVHGGEVVALYGKLGSGIAEVAEVTFGVRKLSAGSFSLEQTPRSFAGPRSAIDAGIGLLPADRQGQGCFQIRPVAENLAAPSWPHMGRLGGLITARREARAYKHWHDVLDIRSRNDPAQPMGTLSGGNQQKVLLARWLERHAKALVLIEPTRGVDVGARRDIYRHVRELARNGAGVLVATSDYEEVVQLADRVIVMSRGRAAAHLAGDEITTERLTAAAGG